MSNDLSLAQSLSMPRSDIQVDHDIDHKDPSDL